MGRKKVTLQRISSVKDRAVTFLKRRFGLFKKAHELSILCDCHISLIIVDPDKKRCFQYASESMQTTLDHFNACLSAANENSSSSSSSSGPTGFRSTTVPPVLLSFNNDDMRKILSGKRRSMAALSRGPSSSKNPPTSHEEVITVSQDCHNASTELSYLEDLLNMDITEFESEEENELQSSSTSACSTVMRNPAEYSMSEPPVLSRSRVSLEEFLHQLQNTPPSTENIGTNYMAPSSFSTMDNQLITTNPLPVNSFSMPMYPITVPTSSSIQGQSNYLPNLEIPVISHTSQIDIFHPDSIASLNLFDLDDL